MNDTDVMWEVPEFKRQLVDEAATGDWQISCSCCYHLHTVLTVGCRNSGKKQTGLAATVMSHQQLHNTLWLPSLIDHY
jgi:hypothetical protein